MVQNGCSYDFKFAECQDLFEVYQGKYQCGNQKDEPRMFYYEIVLILEQ